MLMYVMLFCVYVLIGIVFDAYMNGLEASNSMFEPADLAIIILWPIILVSVVVYRPFAYLYKLFFKLGRKTAQRKKAKRK